MFYYSIQQMLCRHWLAMLDIEHFHLTVEFRIEPYLLLLGPAHLGDQGGLPQRIGCEGPVFGVGCGGVIPDAIMGGVRALGEFYLNILINEKDIDWIFFSPTGTIEPGQRTGVFRLGKDDLIVDEKGNSRISVEDYAMAMVDEMETPKQHYERFTIGY